MTAGPASPRCTRSWLSWVTSAPVTPSPRARQSGILPYSSTTGLPLSVWYSTCPWRITRPAGGSQVSVPPPCPVTVYDPAYPSVAATGVAADRSSCTTASVAGAAPSPPGPGDAAAENTPARHPATTPAASTTTSPAATPPATRRRGPACCAATLATSCWPASPRRDTVPLTTPHLTRCRGVLRG